MTDPVSTAAAPPRAGDIRLAELLGALSHALDMTEGQPAGHCVRCCWIGTQIGRELGLDDASLWELYYTLLLKDLGCSSNAARICQLYLTDDLQFKRGFKQIDGSLPQALRFVLAHTGLQAGLTERFRALINIFQNGGKLGVSNAILDKPGKLDEEEWAAMKMHAAYSQTILSRIAAFRDLAVVAGAHHERLDGKGYPRGLSGDDICLDTRIITTADIFDALTSDRPYRAAMPVSKALAIMSEMAGTAIDPECLQALQRALRRVDHSLAA